MEDYLEELNKKEVNATVGDKNTTFGVYLNGTVVDQDGTVICEQGGDQCLEDYI